MQLLFRFARCAFLLVLVVLLGSAGTLRASAEEARAPATLTQDQIRELIRRSADNDLQNDKKRRDYTYVERQETRRLDGKGQVKSTEAETYEVMEIYGEQVEKLIAKNGRPLSEKDARKEDEKLQKLIDKRNQESDADRRKRLEKAEKEREEDRQFVREVADAFNFTFVGIEKLDGRDNYVIDGDPRPGYKPVHKQAGILPKIKFRVWIDTQDSQMKKLDAQFLDTVSFGLFLVRLHKGSRAIIENTRVNNEVWLQQHIAVKVDARVALLKTLDVEVDVSDRDYKKFRADTRIVPIADSPSGQVQPPPR